jgi:hypothetical protein
VRSARTAFALLVLGAAQALCAAAPARGAEAVPEDPPRCREALAAHPEDDALEALARAEADAATSARKARAEARRILRKHIGTGEQGGLAATEAADAQLRRAAELRREGKVLCHCRQRRGDPDREDCEFLYPEKLP